jgi:serine protease Do
MSGCSEDSKVQRLLRTELVAMALGGALGLALCGVAFAGEPAMMSMGPVGYEAMSAGSSSHAQQGYLGVLVRDVGTDEISILKLKESHGAVILRVDHDAPAGKCGLHEQDVIVQMNGQVIDGRDQLLRMLRETPIGRTITLTISRDGQLMSITTQTANRETLERQAWEKHMTVPDPALSAAAPVPAPAANESRPAEVAPRGNGFFSSSTSKTHNFIGAITPGSAYTGATVETLGPQLAEFFGAQGEGVLVHSVDAESPAASAGLRAGDVVLRANSVTISTSSDWTKMMRENRGKKVTVVVLRDKKEQTLTLIPDAKKRSAVDSKGVSAGGNRTAAGFALR